MQAKQLRSKFKYEVIKDHFRKAIVNGVIPAGNKIPSVRQTAKQFSYSISVVLQAYQEMEAENLISGVEKSGYFALASDENTTVPRPEDYRHNLTSQESTPHSLTTAIVDMSSDKSILPLGCATPSPDILPLKTIKKHLVRRAKTFTNELSEYAESSGALRLREEISKIMVSRGVTSPPQDLILTNGCMEGLSIALQAATEPGDTVAIESPCYFGLITLLQQLKRRVIPIPTSSITGLSLKSLRDVVQNQKLAAVIVSPNFQNPLGSVMSQSARLELLEIAENYDLTIIEDDIYGECSFTQKDTPPLKMLDKNNLHIYCTSFSKTVSPGVRIGWLIGGKHHSKCRELKFNQSLGNPRIIQEAMADFLSSGGYNYHIRRFRKKITQQTHTLKKLLTSSFPRDTKISAPSGGFFLWLEFPNQIDSMQLYQKALDLQIGIVPGAVFSCEKRLFKNCMRISCGFPVTEETERGIETLARLIKEMS